ncbi:hypothetical protein Gotur_007983 [Gossypium turneri]
MAIRLPRIISSKKVPKGYFAVYVGENQKRFVIPVSFLSQPLFQELLGKSEEEFGYSHPTGGLTIPCDEDIFLDLQPVGHTSGALVLQIYTLLKINMLGEARILYVSKVGTDINGEVVQLFYCEEAFYWSRSSIFEWGPWSVSIARRGRQSIFSKYFAMEFLIMS